jgi:DNA-binding NtrC family response regulator
VADILIVDDDHSVGKAFQTFVEFDGHSCRIASSAADAIRLIGERRPNLVMMDVRMPGVDGLQALKRIRDKYPEVYVVIMTAYGTSQTSIDAIRSGAFDYLMKPLDLGEIRRVIDKVLATQQVSDQTPATAAVAAPPMALIGTAPAMLDIYKMIGRLASHDVPALLVGERGTGKRLIALTIHDNCDRDRPFVTIDCGEMSEASIDAALFSATKGTVHIDRIEELPAAIQARLARAMGDDRARTTEGLAARVIASTGADLADRSVSGSFNQELYEALAVITIGVPPLRERRADIPLLVAHFIQRCNSQLGRSVRGVDDAVTRRFEVHPWPGNVDELERVVRRSCIVTRTDIITRDDVGDGLDQRFSAGVAGASDDSLERAVRMAFHDHLVQGATSSSYHEVLDAVESTLVKEALTLTNGNRVKAAELLGVTRSTLRKKLPSA